MNDIGMSGYADKRDYLSNALTKFLTESNAIEGIVREPTKAEIDGLFAFLLVAEVTTDGVLWLARVFEPLQGQLRGRKGMDVSVGTYTAPPGGKAMRKALDSLLSLTNLSANPWSIYNEYESLHPLMDGNGRTGRAIWLHMMQRLGMPHRFSFLEMYHYQTLENYQKYLRPLLENAP